MSRHRILDSIEDPVMRNLHNWPDIDVPEEDKEHYDATRQLLMDWYDNANVRDVVSQHNVTTAKLYYWLNKCIAPGRSGGIRGLAALRRYSGDRPYVRQSDSRKNYSGRFQKFLKDYPKIAAAIASVYHNGFASGRDYGGVMLESNVLSWFDELCAQGGIRQDQYPRCLKSKGRKGLNTELRRLDEVRSVNALRKREGQKAETNFHGTEHRDESRLCIYPYREIEVDAHDMDLMMVVLVITPEGVVKPELIGRCWLYAAIDVASRAIIGYHLSLNEKVTREDFLQCIANTLRPWKPKELTIPGLYYPEDSGLPSGVIEGCGWRKFSLIRLDNDRIHLSKEVCRKLMRTTGCTVHLGKPGVPLGRPFIERFFGTLEHLGWHQLPSTVGSDPKDPRRRNPGRVAKKYRISLDEIEQVLDVFIARHNATSTSVAPLYHTSPLNYLENFILTEPILTNCVSASVRERLPMLCDTVRVTVRGNKKDCRQPYFQWNNAVYKNTAMRGTWSLIGEELDIAIYRDEISVVIGTLVKNGASIGPLHAQPPWHRPHSYRTRHRITKHPSRIHFEKSSDAVLAYQRHLALRMGKSSKAAKEVVRMEREKHAMPGSPQNPINSNQYFERQPDFEPSGDDWVDV